MGYLILNVTMTESFSIPFASYNKSLQKYEKYNQ